MAAVYRVGWLVWLNRSWNWNNEKKVMDMAGDGKIKTTLEVTTLVVLAVENIFYHLVNLPVRRVRKKWHKVYPNSGLYDEGNTFGHI